MEGRTRLASGRGHDMKPERNGRRDDLLGWLHWKMIMRGLPTKDGAEDFLESTILCLNRAVLLFLRFLSDTIYVVNHMMFFTMVEPGSSEMFLQASVPGAIYRSSFHQCEAELVFC